MNTSHHKFKFLATAIVLLFFVFQPLDAQSRRRSNKNTVHYPESTYASLKYRSIGPFRGGVLLR